MIKTILEDIIKQSILDLNYNLDDIVLSIPQNNQHGDYSSNIALQLAKQKNTSNNQTPVEIANQISEKLTKRDYILKVEVVEPGFLNLFIKPEFIASDIKTIIEQAKDFGRSDINQGKRARVEFVSANPTGPLHIGNARGGPLGDVVASVLSSQGYLVTREYIHNNVGGQVKKLGLTLASKIGYPVGITPQKDQELFYQGEYINELAGKVKRVLASKYPEGIKYKQLSDFEAEAGDIGVELLLSEIVTDMKGMGIVMDQIVNESDLRLKVPEVIGQLKQLGVLKQKDGALWFAPSDKFLKDRETVVVKSTGEFTYFASDIVYHKQKFDSADLVVDIFGSNHSGHIPRLQAVVAALGFDPQKLKFVLYQYVRVKRGNQVVGMSKRAGNFITAREVLDEVGVDAFRFFLLSFDPQTHLDFDVELVKQQSSKNPVYYVQYAHARMHNILNKAKLKGQADTSLLTAPQEIELIKHLAQYPGLLKQLASSLQVHQLTFYSVALAEKFHKFYETCQVLTAGSGLSEARLHLVKASSIVLSNVLDILGVSAPEQM